ncbi:MAG: lipoprotein signal peptidase [Acidobacteriota bacterium]
MTLTESMRGKGRYVALAGATLALDQWTKWLVESHLPLHSSHELLPFLHLSHVRNTGVAFGLFASGGSVIGTIALALLGIAVLSLVGWFFSRTPLEHGRALVALALVLGGAVGNLLDRIASGGVTDFVGVYLGSYRWPDFNVADSAICIGVAILLFEWSRAPAPTPDEA